MIKRDAFVIEVLEHEILFSDLFSNDRVVPGTVMSMVPNPDTCPVFKSSPSLNLIQL